MADILNRLLLDTKNFDANLASSKRSVGNYSSGVSDMAKTAGLGIGKLAGALGLAMGAGEAFNRTLNSSQTLGDMTARNIEALKTSVDSFFYSLGSGDFSHFINGLGDMINAAKDAHGAIDQLGNTKISHGYFSSENEGKIAESQYVAKNKFAPLEDRVKAFESWKNALNAQSEINDTLQADLINSIVKSVEAEIGTGKLKVSMNDVRMALKIDVTNPSKRSELKERYANDYSYYSQAMGYADRKTWNYDADGNALFTKDEILKKSVTKRMVSDSERTEKLTELNNKYREAIIVNAMLNKYKDNELMSIAGMASEYQKLKTALSSVSREYNETAMEFNNSNKAIKGFVAVTSLEGHKVYSGQANNGNNKPAPPPVGSIAAIDAELSKLNKELITATTTQARIAAQTTIDELEARKIKLKFEAQYGEGKLPNASGDKMAGLSYNKGSDLKKFKQPKMKSPVGKKDVDMLDKYQEGLYGIGDAMHSMSGIMGEGAASWLNWGASLLSSVAQAIPAIKNLIPALQAKAAGEAVAGASSAGPLGWISAGAAVLSIIAAFASIPKFANGGVIQNGSTFGDMNLARVNAGEMILNGVQQGNLFRLLNNGNDTMSGNGGTVSFRIKGKDLEGVLNNYNSQKNRVK